MPLIDAALTSLIYVGFSTNEIKKIENFEWLVNKLNLFFVNGGSFSATNNAGPAEKTADRVIKGDLAPIDFKPDPGNDHIHGNDLLFGGTGHYTRHRTALHAPS